jgi:glycosyltransferase involved in cell wall biosynthesis
MNSSMPLAHAMYVTPGLRGGGAERLLTTMLLQQRSQSERMSVVSLRPGGVFRPTLEHAGISVTDLGWNSKRDVLRSAFALAAIIRAEQPTVVYGWMYAGNLLALFAQLLAGRPRAQLFWTVLCTDGVGPRFHPWSRIVRGVSALLSRWVSGVIYNAEEGRAYHRRIGFRERRSVVLSNIIDPAIFQHDGQKRGALRAELAIDSGDVVVGMVARVDPMKDWGTVQLAVRDLPGVVTVAIGEGTDALPPQAGFIGLGWRDDVVTILSAADIFLLGSAFGEGTSLALGEAMLCGLPCIVTDVGGNARLAGAGGIVVEPRNAAAIREAILQLVSDRSRREALGSTARARGLAAVSRHDTFRSLHVYSLGRES